MIARLAIVMGLVEVGSLEQCLYPCGPDTPLFQLECPSANAVDMAGPRGQEPFIQWVTPRVPIGASTIEVRGRQFGTDKSKLKLELVANGAVATANILTLQGDEPDRVLTAQVTWAGGAMPGSAQVVLTSSETGASNGQSVLLVKPAFQPVASTTMLPAAASSVYLGTGVGATQQALYAVVGQPMPSLVSVLYDGGSGALTALTTFNGGTVAAAPAVLSLPRPTEFVALGKTYELLSCTWGGAYSCSGSIEYGRPWTKATVVGSGTTDKSRELIAVAAEDQSIYRCFYDHSQMTTKEQPCVKIPMYQGGPKKLWVGQLGAAGRADILALSATGTLTLLRDGTGTDVFTDQTSVLPQAAGTAWQAVVVEDVDGVSGKDVVAVGPSGVTTWLNKGDGTFAAPTTDPVGIAARELILGDVDNDNKPDVILLPQNGDGLQILLNLSGTSPGNGRFSAPAPALDVLAGTPIAGVTGSLVTVDGGAGGAKRRLIILSGTTMTAWDNKVLP